MPTSAGRLPLFFEGQLEPGLTNAWMTVTSTRTLGFEIAPERLWFAAGHAAKHDLGLDADLLTTEAIRELAVLQGDRIAQASPDRADSRGQYGLRGETGAIMLRHISKCAGALILCGDPDGLVHADAMFAWLQGDQLPMSALPQEA